ncbi:MAG: dTDP-4-dehydrorhamnose 3,5-epimerase family protein [Chitinophagales bacterium]
MQDNQSKSEYGVLRGMHRQEGEHAQAKLVSVFRRSSARYSGRFKTQFANLWTVLFYIKC